MKKKSKLQGYLWFAGMMVVLSGIFSATFLLTRLIYKFIGYTPPALVIQIINSLGGLILIGFIINTLSHMFKSKIAAGEMRVFGPIIEALERIAKGDFSARVNSISDKPSHERGVVTELVHSVNQMALQLDQMEQMRQEFISNVSHEIQSPLTSIRGFAQALHNDKLNHEEQVHYLSIIETESTRLSRITENLLRLASLESPQVKFEPRPYRLDKQIRDLILACEPQWSGKNIEMDVSLEPTDISADEDLLSQVWINLLHNSIKFTPENGNITIELCQQNGKIEFRIKDSGIGISAEDQTHIFERFYKADKSRTRSNNGGSGLGLSIAQKIVDMHQGEIRVESELQNGTTFMVTLPSLY
jgi:signal transduction histidine kinase